MDSIPRKSHTSLGQIYFWTATIHKWLPLLELDKNKELIIDFLREFSEKKLITVYGFVIMPLPRFVSHEPK